MDRLTKKINNMAMACEYLAIAASLLYAAECPDEMIECHTVLDCVKLDIADLTQTHFPTVERTKR